MKLSKTAIDRMWYAKEDGKQDIRWDNVVPGFGVRVYPTERKAYVLSYRTGGRKHIMVVDQCSVKTLDQARKKAKKLLAHLDTTDPLEAKRKLAQGETMKALCDAYMERHAIPHKKTWKEDQRRVDTYIIPRWGNLKVQAITRADVASLHSKIGKNHRYEANRVLDLVAKMFELARRWGFVEDVATNPARDIDKFKEKKRDRWVTHEELPQLARAIEEESNIYARYALWLYLLTGMRKSELLAAKWEDVDFQRKELRLEETKAGGTHYVPLSDASLSILQKIPHEDNNPYILPGLKEGKHLVNIDKPWQRVRKAAGVEDVRLHDLRRTVGSWLAQAGNSLHLVGRVLNHSNPSTTAIYAHFGEDQVRNALEEHGRLITQAADM